MYRFRNCNVGIRLDSFQVGCETAARFMLGVYSLRKLVFLTERQNKMRFDNYSYKIELQNEDLCKVNGKGEKKPPKKLAMVWPKKLYPVGMEAITSRKTRNYKEKTKSRFDSKN